jgi:hypothetical protein
LSKPCEVCQRSITAQFIKQFLEPSAFSLRVDEKEGTARYRRSTLIRQRQTITHFIDHVFDDGPIVQGLRRLITAIMIQDVDPDSISRPNLCGSLAKFEISTQSLP